MRIAVILVVLVALVLGILHLLGTGITVTPESAGVPHAREISPSVVAERSARIRAAGTDIGVAQPKQILFGDLHVHTTFSFDAFQLSLPMAGGDGAHPVSDACDFARHCAALDFWSINDHAIVLNQRRWQETVDSIRQCNAVASNPGNPDTVAFLGWEWTQVGWTPERHYGHKNVILRDLEDGMIPSRPISAGLPVGTPPVDETAPSSIAVGAFSLLNWSSGGPELAQYLHETAAFRDCPKGVPVRELPADCRDSAHTPEELFSRLDEWGHEALVIPHGTTWGFYTPLGSAWDKQLAPGMHDPQWQRLIEVFSGHGNSEEFRPFREVILNPDGSRSCPEPNHGYLPSCWRAGEIIEARCLAKGEGEDECAQRAAAARQHFVDADRNAGFRAVPGTDLVDWQDAGQCRDCFQPAFNYRPRSAVQYIMALRRNPGDESGRFRFGFMASSDNHSARPGTGYKEFARSEFTEARFGNFIDTPLGERSEEKPAPRSKPVESEFSTAIFSIWESERGASFFLNGGLAAVHSDGRDRGAIWDALQRREVYGTSGPRILLWFDLLNSPTGRPAPMGSSVALDQAPIFQVRATGSFEQKPGCPADATAALEPDQLARICQGECYYPSDQRRRINRIEVVRIRPQAGADEPVEALIEDPWRVMLCPKDRAGCQVAFSDPEFARSGRDALYYVRAIEEPSPAVGADPLGCSRNASGRCVDVDACSRRDRDDDCLAETEERAWSSPIFVDQKRS